jgi:hypothetical protein
MKTWIARISVFLLAAGLAVLANSCMPFNPLTAAGMAGVKIYWASGNSIYRANLDGSSQELVYSEVPGANISAVAVDNINGKIYYSESMMNMRTFSVNLDGTGREEIANVAGSSLAINSSAGKLYIGMAGGEIFECALAGAGATIIKPAGTSVDDLDYDQVNNRLYWISSGDIYRSPVGGTLSGTPITAAAGASSMALDPLGGKIYWGSTGAMPLRTTGLDGGSSTSIPGYMGEVYELGVDPFEGQLYWTAGASREQFYRMSVSGGSAPVVFSVSGTSSVYLDLWP